MGAEYNLITKNTATCPPEVHLTMDFGRAFIIRKKENVDILVFQFIIFQNFTRFVLRNQFEISSRNTLGYLQFESSTSQDPGQPCVLPWVS